VALSALGGVLLGIVLADPPPGTLGLEGVAHRTAARQGSGWK
jgi:hypothetical protein